MNYLELDEAMLYSMVNMKLRDFYRDLEDFCLSENVDQSDFKERLNELGLNYNKDTNQLEFK
ncbi:DUF4250 domain-containing protein [uncultured Helcococcus sp.]|uniref:DUF4250 domain-containing protein n=1 Tax=uncultured Helcococcus sp. TaxID=1072508 RepID=UPI002623437C|nr:DUF4250 domain-containing protein [uncultured Helcococcus sp.]